MGFPANPNKQIKKLVITFYLTVHIQMVTAIIIKAAPETTEISAFL